MSETEHILSNSEDGDFIWGQMSELKNVKVLLMGIIKETTKTKELRKKPGNYKPNLAQILERAYKQSYNKVFLQ